MQPVSELHRDLVLVGGGHSHALALRMLAMQAVDGLRVTLVSPASHTPYSGMLPGLIAGHYTFEQTHIDLERLCQCVGARFICASVTGIDPAARRLTIEGRPDLYYDLVSLDIGSEPDIASVPGAATYATPVKPVATLWQRWQLLEERLETRQANAPCRIALVGGGAGSVELALAMAHRLGRAAALELWCGATDILQGYNARARRSVRAALAAAAVQVHTDARVVRVEAGTLHAEDGRQADFDELFWCTAAAAAPWVSASGLPTDEQGFLAVNAFLQSPQEPSVFAAGDIATQIADPRPKAGVYAVRQAPILVHNLRAALLGRALKPYRPQRRFLSLLSLGDRRATADKGSFTATGAWVWRWKDHIDRKFMRQFSELEAMDDTPGTRAADNARLPELEASDADRVCGGCGAKVGADALRRVLAQLAEQFPRHCSNAGDDAVAIPASGSGTVLQSLDVLRQIVSDPWLMGRIAANHALSDLYACGARPVSALASVTLPFARESILERDLHQMLAGAVHEFAAVDCVLNGGHSLQGAELQLGFAVNGVPVDSSGRLLRKRGARPGDQLVLTKPLGSGALFAAHMRGLADGRDIGAAVAAMLIGNGPAAELALDYGAAACTDVTGFGLLGHLVEMIAEDVGAVLYLDAIPHLPGAQAALDAGVASTMAPANRSAFDGRLRAEGDGMSAARQLLYDPQTSGGLLLAVDAAQAPVLCAALVERGYAAAAIVGEIQSGAAGAVSLAPPP